MPPDQEALRKIPSVEKMLQALASGDPEIFSRIPRSVATGIVRSALADLRKRVAKGASVEDPFEDVRATLGRFADTRITPVINGTGVLIHTNLGRSPVAAAAAETLASVASSYSNVEIDLHTGARGPRAKFLEACLATLCRSEAATVVNNCAAGLVLVLQHLAAGEKNEVIVSRGELVEIGGGFRIPEILEASGAKLIEVGATNKTHLADYERAITDRTGLLLKVHRSNFYMEGFTAEPETSELAALAKKSGIPFMHDLGSGAMMQTDQLAPLEHETTPWETLAAGCDLVCFSGDKLLGGPQAGIIAGRADLIAGIKKTPFYRAVRPDKVIFTLLQETACAYLDAASGETKGLPEIPVVQMLAIKEDALLPRAESITKALSDSRIKIGEGTARCGGGTMPKSSIPSVTLEFHLEESELEPFAFDLRTGRPGIVGYIDSGIFKLDLRTIFPHQDEKLISALKNSLLK
ncbi:L-seryl-tRNA(Sec) selenium transferase [Verrucomicrobiales bacterium]|nr:L-seryl-tRNA(Sec) selenium transferase [Verrucomicrobiales bacterium]